MTVRVWRNDTLHDSRKMDPYPTSKLKAIYYLDPLPLILHWSSLHHHIGFLNDNIQYLHGLEQNHFLSRDRQGQTKDACVVCTTKYTRHLLSVGFIGCCWLGELQICHKLLTGLLHHMLWMMSLSSGLRCGRPICPFLSSNMGHLSGS